MSKKITLKEFIDRANKVHCNKYDYTNFIYRNMHTKGSITCSIHGDFQQTPHNHLRKQGCPECAKLKYGAYQKSNTEDFIKKAKQVHHNKYDYSMVEYKNNYTKICIICPEHGEFFQKPNDHLKSHGCPECGKIFGISEKKVLEALKEEYKNVVYQYRPQWLHNKTSSQSIDFFLPDYNIGIEYQGRQHFYTNKRFGGKVEFQLTQERDKLKFHKCTNNNVKLFYISFEKKIPNNYHATIHTTIENLISAINENITRYYIIV